MLKLINYTQAIFLIMMSLMFANNATAGNCNPNANHESTTPGNNGTICLNGDGSVNLGGIDNAVTPVNPVVITTPDNFQPQTTLPSPLPGNAPATVNISLDPNAYIDPSDPSTLNPLYGAQFNTNAGGANTPTSMGNTNGQTTIYSNSNGVNFYGPNGYGGPGVQLHGIAPGTAGTDAVNVDQLNAAINGAFSGAYTSALKQGLSAVAAISNVPRLDRDKMFSVGIGFGGVGGESAYAAGAALRLTDNVIVNGTVGRAFGSNSLMNTTTWGAGAAIGW